MQISDTEYEATSCQRKTEPAEQQPAASAFLANELDKLTSLLSKGSENFSAWVIEACRRRLTSEKREHIHQLKVMKNEHPAFFPSEQDDVINSLNYEGIAVIELQFFTTFLTVTDCVCSVTD